MLVPAVGPRCWHRRSPLLADPCPCTLLDPPGARHVADGERDADLAPLEYGEAHTWQELSTSNVATAALGADLTDAHATGKRRHSSLPRKPMQEAGGR